MNVEVGLSADFVAPDMILALVFVIYQRVAEFEVLDKNDRGGVIDNILQRSSLARRASSALFRSLFSFVSSAFKSARSV